MNPETAIAEPPPTSRTTPAPGTRSAEQIRDDIVARRRQLGTNVETLRGRVTELTDMRGQIRRHRGELLLGAAIVGSLVVGAIALRRRAG